MNLNNYCEDCIRKETICNHPYKKDKSGKPLCFVPHPQNSKYATKSDKMNIRTFKVDFFGGGYTQKEWFKLSLEAFIDEAPSDCLEDYDHIQIIPLTSYKKYFFSNDGTQAFRHKGTGWTMPDYCRQVGGCPEIWNKSKRRNLEILEDSPIWNFIVV